MRRQQLLGWIIGPTIWISNLTLMVYGLAVQAWYGYAIAVVFVAGAICVLVAMHRARKKCEAAIERHFNAP
jgi:hypothetical protein